MNYPLHARTRAARYSWPALLGLLACAPWTSIEDALQEHRKESGVRYLDCGEASEDFCPQDFGPSEQCFLDAAAQCEPALLQATRTTIEGDPIEYAWLVEPAEDGSCEFTQFVDNTADEFTSEEQRRITEERCTTLQTDESECAAFWLEDCELVSSVSPFTADSKG